MVSQRCNLCLADAAPLFSATVMSAIVVTYFRCPQCQLIQTQAPTWLESAYDKAVSAADTGAATRNVNLARLAAVLFSLTGLGRSRIVDYAGGYGLFTRLMRDRGFDCRWTDQYTQNLFARGFEHEAGQTADVVTAFEVLEHLTEPRRFFDEVANTFQGRVLLCSTTCYPPDIGPDWWYLTPHIGQHVSFYNAETFHFVARQYGWHYQGDGPYHLLSREAIPAWKLRAAVRYGEFLLPILRRRVDSMADYRVMFEKIVAAQSPPGAGGSKPESRSTGSTPAKHP